MKAHERLMAFDNKLWAKHGWQSSSMVDKKVYQKELKAFVGKRKFSEKTYDALENENFHTLNAQLGKAGKFKERRLNLLGKQYG